MRSSSPVARDIGTNRAQRRLEARVLAQRAVRWVQLEKYRNPAAQTAGDGSLDHRGAASDSVQGQRGRVIPLVPEFRPSSS
jgi:hypothetical protein